MFFSIITCVGLLAGGALAAPAMGVRDVVAPPITFPTSDTVWTVGEKTHVDWDTSVLPPYEKITNNQGRIVLGYENACEVGYHLDLDHPLASGFNITLGTIAVNVPNVKPRSDYILILFGDSGNTSPHFTINVKIHNPSGPPPPIRVACGASSSTSGSATSSKVITPTVVSTSSDTRSPSTILIPITIPRTSTFSATVPAVSSTSIAITPVSTLSSSIAAGVPISSSTIPLASFSPASSGLLSSLSVTTSTSRSSSTTGPSGSALPSSGAKSLVAVSLTTLVFSVTVLGFSFL